ncbi:ABC transporter substrate-binding protein [Lacibacterium aquatile]|uniref:ABC transporter substrate-binding protein n=1 Tax=Lacibacterium aquatile TaxID=1168082 RepID=A0ABW5DQV1_9PROT
MKPSFTPLFLAAVLATLPASANWTQSPALEADVAQQKLPTVEMRLPVTPLQSVPTGSEPGQYGGELRLLGASPKDVRLMAVYGYSRLVAYDADFNLKPDLLEKVDVAEGRIFTFRLREGHKWSNGQPFTSEDFRYFWEDVALNKELSPTGPPIQLLVDGQVPKVEILDEWTVRYTWDQPNPTFLNDLAGAAPVYIYRPSQYLKQFHGRYTDKDALAKLAKEKGARGWPALHNRLDNQYRNDNPDLPTLDPWVNRTKAPSERFVFTRNPYFHRVDAKGQQLPYIDRVVMQIAESKIIPVKTGAGEADLQARYLMFDNYAFLKQAAKDRGASVDLWHTGRGAHLALYPNLTAADPVWRDLMRDVRFRRALSLGVDRREINHVVFYGLATEGDNSLLKESPLYRQAMRLGWSRFDLKQANALLDEIGLKRGSNDLGPSNQRLLPDGRPMTIVVEAGGDSADQVDALQLVRDSWAELGIKLLTKSMQQDVFRNRCFAGETVMSIGPGAENGLATAAMSPAEWAPTNQVQWQWSQWGNFYETSGKAGERPSIPEAERLLTLYDRWRRTQDDGDRTEIWQQMMAIHADQQFVIGLVADVPQPVWINKLLRNVPRKAMYNWEPGAHFGLYRPDLFWFDDPSSAHLK